MDDETARRLIRLGVDFYDRFAAPFAESRSAPWPGFARVVEGLEARTPLRVLDVGAGSGRFLRFLDGRAQLEYLGLDASPRLVEHASSSTGGRFAVRDVVVDGLPDGAWDLMVAFGLFHHVPGAANRARLFGAMAQRVAPGGRMAVTFWRLEAERFRKKVVPWSELFERTGVQIDERALEQGDLLLTWERGGSGLRYCHHTSDEEIETLVSALQLELTGDFESDGASGRTNRYVVLSRPDNCFA